MQATFKGGYTLAVWKADVATARREEIWHNERERPRVHDAEQSAASPAIGSCSRSPSAAGGRGGRGLSGASDGAPEPSG